MNQDTTLKRILFFLTPIDGRYEDLKKGNVARNVFKDLTAGLIVAMVAIPLAMGFAMASGLRPEQGIVGGAVALGVLGAALSENDKDRNHHSDRPRQIMRCESDGDYRRCRADIRNGVRLYRQLSKASCRQNESWGYDQRGVWVNRGCRAEFALD